MPSHGNYYFECCILFVSERSVNSTGLLAACVTPLLLQKSPVQSCPSLLFLARGRTQMYCHHRLLALGVQAPSTSNTRAVSRVLSEVKIKC